jgi:hypothetical protein
VQKTGDPESRKRFREDNLRAQGKMSAEMFAGMLGCSVDAVKYYLRLGPNLWPDKWRRMGVNVDKLLDRQYVIWLDPDHPMLQETAYSKKKLRRIARLSARLDEVLR